MFRLCSCVFVFSFLTVLPVRAQETTPEEELLPPSQITEAQKLQAQKNVQADIDFIVQKREPQQMKRILKASETVEKSKIRQKNRFLPTGEQIRYQEKKINVNDKEALKKYFTETYVTEPSIVEPATTSSQTEAR